MLVIATGSRGRLFNVNEMRIKVSSSYPSGHIEVLCPLDKKISLVKNVTLMSGKLLQKRFIKKEILRAPGCLILTGGCYFSNLRPTAVTVHALQCPGVSGMEMKIYE